MVPSVTRWTAELVRNLPEDGKRYEVVDGELLVTPSPTYTHHRVVLAFLEHVAPFVRAHGSPAASCPICSAWRRKPCRRR